MMISSRNSYRKRCPGSIRHALGFFGNSVTAPFADVRGLFEVENKLPVWVRLKRMQPRSLQPWLWPPDDLVRDQYPDT